MIKQVFILAAGKGTRMMPLTKNTPKPLIEVNNISMLDRILQKIENLPNIDKILINGFYLADNLEKYIKNLHNNKICFIKESVPFETGGGLVNALPYINQDEPILMINGDIVWQDAALLSEFIDDFIKKDCDILLGLKRKEQFLGYEGGGDFDIIDNKIIKNKSGEYVYTGIQILHPRILKLVKLPQIPFSLSYFFNNTSKIKLQGVDFKSKMFHIGDPQSLKKYGNLVDL